MHYSICMGQKVSSMERLSVLIRGSTVSNGSFITQGSELHAVKPPKRMLQTMDVMVSRTLNVSR